jgi:hypothetical protein
MNSKHVCGRPHDGLRSRSPKAIEEKFARATIALKEADEEYGLDDTPNIGRKTRMPMVFGQDVVAALERPIDIGPPRISVTFTRRIANMGS